MCGPMLTKCQEAGVDSLCVLVIHSHCKDGITQKGLTTCFMTSMGRDVRYWLEVMY